VCLPRLAGGGDNRVAVWTAGAGSWRVALPFNNGLRPEPMIASHARGVGLVKSAIATAPVVVDPPEIEVMRGRTSA